MSSDPNKQTIETYDKIADQHVERAKQNGWWDTPLEPAFSKFTAHLKPGDSVLDLGCGTGQHTRMFSQYNAIGLDLSTGMLTEARKYSDDHFVQGNMLHLPFPNHSFDGVWMCASLLHLPRELASDVFKETRRILKGTLYVSVKQGMGEEFATHLGRRFFTYYEVDELIGLMDGFDILEQWISEPNWINIIAIDSA